MRTSNKMWMMLLKQRGCDNRHIHFAARMASRYWEAANVPLTYAVEFGYQVANQKGFSR